MPDPLVSPGGVAVFSKAELTRSGWTRFLASRMDAGSRPARLASALEQLGGVYAQFARFLSWRADLLPSAYLLALRDVRDNAPPLSRADFQRILMLDLGGAGEALAKAIESEPAWSTPQRCAYRSTWKGEKVA